jgi:D-serine deaminase-like pyridoxal phosphate-dependent protein
MWRKDQSGPRDPYFLEMQEALRAAGRTEPVLILDRARLRRNIERLQSDLPKGMALRLVAKSLPVADLLQMAASVLDTHRYMTFNLPMLRDVARMDPDAEQLLGKPLPVASLAAHYDANAPGRVIWLVDTERRLNEYAELAQARGVILDVVLELDVGLHRGGFVPGPELARAVQKLRAGHALRFRGLMGYDAHVAKAPQVFGLRRRAAAASLQAYRAALVIVTEGFGGIDPTSLILNAAGSPTFRLHGSDSVANDLSVGSVLVKPTDFDTDLLAAYESAVFIATPALKVSGAMRTPILETFDPIKRWANPNLARSVFVHGGYWKARPVDPPGLVYNATYGRSSNQELLTGGPGTQLDPDDTVFLRPSQSEAVLMQFGPIAIYDEGRIAETWAPFATSL